MGSERLNATLVSLEFDKDRYLKEVGHLEKHQAELRGMVETRDKYLMINKANFGQIRELMDLQAELARKNVVYGISEDERMKNVQQHYKYSAVMSKIVDSQTKNSERIEKLEAAIGNKQAWVNNIVKARDGGFDKEIARVNRYLHAARAEEQQQKHDKVSAKEISKVGFHAHTAASINKSQAKQAETPRHQTRRTK